MQPDKDKIGPRARESVGKRRAVDTVANFTEISGYRFSGAPLTTECAPLAFNKNGELWSAIFKGIEATENRRVELHGFWLTEWTPLRPGRFHTPNASAARRLAMNQSQIHADDNAAPHGLRDAVAGNNGWPRTRIFNPYGKASMVDGGIGCVRLKPVANHMTHRWVFGASSSRIVHEGALVVLNDNDRDRLIADVRRFGGLKVALYGTLRFVQRGDITEPMFGRGIPQLYIEVDRIEPEFLHSGQSRRLDVTAAVTFTSHAGRHPSLNVSYVTFNAAEHGDLERAVQWLDDVYVRDSYQGTVVTDFDEQTAHFEHARFSLHKLLNGLVRREDVNGIEDELGLPGELMDVLRRHRIVILGDVHGDVYLAEQAVAMGRNASVSDTDVTINRKGSR